MLGHSASAAHIHAINLTQNKSLILKRIGYLMCSLFFNKDSDLLIMLVSTILKDLSSPDVHEVVICLTALGNIMNNTIAEGINEAVLKLTHHATDLVRKKAVLILQKIVNLFILYRKPKLMLKFSTIKTNSKKLFVIKSPVSWLPH